MFYRLSKRLLLKPLYSFQTLKTSTVLENSTKKNVTFINKKYGNVSSKKYLTSRAYSTQTKLEEMIVDYNQVKRAVSNQNSLIIDVREPEEIKKHGNIPNSIKIPLGNLSTVLNSMSDIEFEQIYGRKKPKDDTEIIFYCMIGKRSGMAQQNTISLGYKNVKNYVGSWTDWASRTQL
ncbi:unnamed protein product [Parnassius apollo]|uniref:(apollo) hypothetical protein n=1 Tax=Parnassius apollo TaxID=110799 RepID=A0A8S3X025_PARAO|nr:unnamed protein product [Parnassius apollo]